MIFTETKLKGAYIIEVEPIGDARGFFARAFCKKEFADKGLESELTQCNISYNKCKGTLRGMHYQVDPHREVKMVRCIRGSIYDVIIDLREDSPTYKQWIGVELTGENRKMLYVPKGFAHGFQTLEDNTELYYHVTEFYHQQSERGIRWDDKQFNIQWPQMTDMILSEKDSKWGDFEK